MSDSVKDVIQQALKVFSRDEARCERLKAEFPQFAMDAAPEESSREFAVRVLTALGAEVPRNFDPLDALHFFYIGRRQAMDERGGIGRPSVSGDGRRRTFGMDWSCTTGDTFIDKYLGEK